MTDLSALAQRAPDYTAEYTYVRGEYAFGTEQLPYFAVTMSISEADQLLTLARDLVFDPREPVKLSDLFQRDLDTSRATGEIKEYLRAPHRVKFFNAFTVVLMPVEGGDRIRPLAGYPASDPSGQGPDEEHAGYTRLDVGTVQIRHLNADANVGHIRWNRRLVRPVIIDGQHRFYALHQLLEDASERFNLYPDTTKIPVLLMVLDERAGYHPGEGTPSSVVETCRQMFIDLNKNAEPVSVARQYLLDDRDLVAVSVRTLLDPESSYPSIPLALVDWHSEQSKFETGLYVTTVLALYDIVKMVIAKPAPGPLDYEDNLTYVEELEARLNLGQPGNDGVWDRTAIRTRLREAENELQPFHLAPMEIHAAAEGFCADLGALVRDPLMNLTPYRALAERYTDAGLLGGDSELWLGHDPAGKKAFQAVTGEDPGPTARTIAIEVKAQYRNAFQVVFQKAIVRSIMRLDEVADTVLEIWDVEDRDEVGRAAFAALAVQQLNERFGRFWGSDSYWAATARSFGGNVDYSKPAMESIAGALILGSVAPMERWRTSAAGATPTATDLSDAGRSARIRIENPTVDGALFVPGMSDRPDENVPPPLQIEALHWLDRVVQRIRPGRPSSELDGLERTACRDWRRQVEKYLKVEARTNSDEPLSDSQRDEGFLLIASQRLALAALELSGSAEPASESEA